MRLNEVDIKNIKFDMIISAQLRAARALLGWSQDQLAQQSTVSKPTIARLELSDGEIGGYASTRDKLQTSLEAAGVIFVVENGEGPGVRLRKTHDDHDALTRKIAQIEGELETSGDEPPKTPAGGMQRLEHAHKHETVKKLKNKRMKLKK